MRHTHLHPHVAVNLKNKWAKPGNLLSALDGTVECSVYLVLCLRLIRRETAQFFGVEESKEDEQQARWLDRRKRLAARRYGSLKDEYMCSDTQRPLRHQQLTSAYTTQASTRVGQKN